MQHRKIPILPVRPRVHPVSGSLTRSYPTGRQSFSRALQGEALSLSITLGEAIPGNVRACILTTLQSTDGKSWTQIPFVRTDDRTLVCQLTPQHPGLHSFRAEFSLDEGATWQRDNLPDARILIDPPQVDALRMYTLIPTVSGTMADWTADLPRIASMGFNAVHLLPITAMDVSESPYSAHALFDIDRSYVLADSQQDGLAQLEDFVAAAATLNIRLVFDLVPNHVGVRSAMATTAPDWIVPDQNQPDGLKRASYWSGQAWCNWNDLVLINYEHPSEFIRSEIWDYMIDYALFWAKYANDTGGFVRFDNLHSSDPAFVTAMTTALHREYPGVGILAEYFADESVLQRTGPEWGLNLNLATPWNCRFVPQLRDYLKFIHRVSVDIRYFMPVLSHDSGSAAQEFSTADATIPRYVAAALMGIGATGMPQGTEFGVAERIHFIGRKEKMTFAEKPRFADFIARVNSILVEYPAFRRGENCWFVDEGHSAVIAAFRRGQGVEAPGFLVVCNFDTSSPQHIVVELGPILAKDSPVSCVELLTGLTHSFPHPRLELALAAGAAQVLKFQS